MATETVGLAHDAVGLGFAHLPAEIVAQARDRVIGTVSRSAVHACRGSRIAVDCER
jgi:hypothetical protein